MSEADDVGAEEPDLGPLRQAVEQIEAAEDRDDSDRPGERRAELARRVGFAAAHHQHADGDRDERGQRPGIGQRGEYNGRGGVGASGVAHHTPDAHPRSHLS